MAARFASMKTCANCCSAAAACSSAQMIPILDTAMILVVSICIICLLPLRVLG